MGADKPNLLVGDHKLDQENRIVEQAGPYMKLPSSKPPFEQTESLRPALHFRVLLGGEGANKLEVVV
jgi:hypothetical protein